MQVQNIISESIKATYKTKADRLHYEAGRIDNRNGGSVMFSDNYYALLVDRYALSDINRDKIAAALEVDRYKLLQQVVQIKKQNKADAVVDIKSGTSLYDEMIQKTDGPLAGLFKKIKASESAALIKLNMTALLYEVEGINKKSKLLRVYKGSSLSSEVVYALIPENYTKAIKAAGSVVSIKDEVRVYKGNGGSMLARINGDGFVVAVTTAPYDPADLYKLLNNTKEAAL